jgi:hypothetical protein
MQVGEDVKRRTNENLFKEVRKSTSSGKILVIPCLRNLLRRRLNIPGLYVTIFHTVALKGIVSDPNRF